VGGHSALLPDFLGRGCLSKDDRGLISYDFGPSCKTENAEDLLTVDENMLNAKICKYKKNKRKNPRSYYRETPIQKTQTSNVNINVSSFNAISFYHVCIFYL
jgi:hypothetical protein